MQEEKLKKKREKPKISRLLGSTKKETVGTKEEKYRIESSKAIKLSAKDLYLAERLINAGVAENLTELMRKSLRLYGGEESAGGEIKKERGEEA